MTAPPTRGPSAAAVVRPSSEPAGPGVRLVYADLDLAERDGLRRALGLDAGDGRSDDALVLAAYGRWGPEVGAQLGGTFAFAVWDGARRAVVAVRDPIGLRPLFWAESDGAVVVGGDLRAILATGAVPDVLDDDILAAALLHERFHPCMVGRTHLRHVHELRGGHVVVADGRGARPTAYWTPEAIPDLGIRTVAEAAEAMRAALRAAIADAVADAGPGELGAHLSPGLDSSSVLSFAAEALAEAGRPPPHAFTWSHRPEPGAPLAPEFQRMRSVVDRWGLPFTYASPDPEAIRDGMRLDPTRDPATMWAPEQPVRRAAQAAGVRVLLSGWGGDEAASFSGRSLVAEHLLRRGRWGPLVAAVARDPVEVARQIRHYRRKRRRSPADLGLDALREAALRGELATYVRPDVLRAADLQDAPPPPLGPPHAYAGWLLSRGHLGMRTGAWAVAGEPYGLRYRFPLLDRRVVAVALGVRPEVWLTRERRRRWVLREAGAGVVPDEIRLGPKMEPLWLDAWDRAASEALATMAPEVRAWGAVSDRARFIDVPRLTSAFEAFCADESGLSRRERRARMQGFHAAVYLNA